VFVQKAGHRLIDVVSPGREQPDMSVLAKMFAHSHPALQDKRVHSSLKQMGGGSQANRASADHHNRQRL
jgi:hypothetical protein